MAKGGIEGWIGSGMQPGAAPPKALLPLRPLSSLYGAIVRARLRAYELGLFKAAVVDRPVISVGNLTLGGTGKTPLVGWIATYLASKAFDVAILTRGYKREATGRQVLRSGDEEFGKALFVRGGDEPALLARSVPGATIVVDKDRVAAAHWASVALDPDVYLLDDGFQHLRLARDLDLLVVDATDPFGGSALPPFGRLREPLRGIGRADAVIVTRAKRAHDLVEVDSVIAKYCRPGVPVFHADHEVVAFRRCWGDEEMPVSAHSGVRVGVLAAVGNPRVFLQDLEGANLDVVSTTLFSDHHSYTPAEVDRAVAAAQRAGAEALVTTEKDAVKLERLPRAAIPFHAARIEVVCEAAEALRKLVLEAVERRSP